MWLYTVGQKYVYCCEYTKHRIYSCVTIYYCVVFHTNNCKRTIAPSFVRTEDDSMKCAYTNDGVGARAMSATVLAKRGPGRGWSWSPTGTFLITVVMFYTMGRE